MRHEDIIKRILENTGTRNRINDKQTEEEIELSKNMTEADVLLLEKEAQMVNLMSKPRLYVIVYIFFRYLIPVFYYRILNFITGV